MMGGKKQKYANLKVLQSKELLQKLMVCYIYLKKSSLSLSTNDTGVR